MTDDEVVKGTTPVVADTTTTSPPTRINRREESDQWSSRIAFYFAAVGAAVGFGNVWRFPALAKTYGGGAFFIPYLLALFLVGIPLLILEIAFGQYWQTGDVGVFGGFHPRFAGVGVASIACGFMLVTYYSMLIAWVFNAFFDSWSDDAPWDNENLNGTTAVGYFYNEIIGMETITSEDLTPTRLVGKNVGYSLLVWFLIFICVAFGIRMTGRITYFTMGLPIILLFVFLGKAVSLEGSEDGIEAYIGEWDTSVLREQGDVWSTAVSQIFFSISITFGIMTAYGSHCDSREPVVVNSFVIAISNSVFSFLSGFAVFGALGHLAYLEGVNVDDLQIKSFALVFGSWPVVLSRLSGGVHWVRLLFFNLILLGIDSAFALLEAVLTVAHDTVAFRNTPKWMIAAFFCTLAWLLSLIYATDAGLFFLDTIDYYINFVMLLVGFFESFAAGWIYGMDRQVEKFGAKAVFTYMFANFGAVALACCFWFGIDASSDHNVWSGFVAFVLFFGFGLAATWMFLRPALQASELGQMDFYWDFAFGNIFELKNLIEPVVGWMPSLWCYMIKMFLPHVLLILFVNLAQTTNENGDAVFGHYEGYATKPYQVLGILTFVFALYLFVFGFVAPQVYAPLAPAPIEEEVVESVHHDGKVEDVNPEDKEDDADVPNPTETQAMDKEDEDVEVEA